MKVQSTAAPSCFLVRLGQQGCGKHCATAILTFALAAVGGTVVGWVAGSLIVWVRTWLADSLVESAIGLVAPFFIYLLAEEVHGSGVIAVVVAALILGQRNTRAGSRPGCRTTPCGGRCSSSWSRSRSS